MFTVIQELARIERKMQSRLKDNKTTKTGKLLISSASFSCGILEEQITDNAVYCFSVLLGVQ